MALDPLIHEFLDKIGLKHDLNFWELPLPAARFAFNSLAKLAGACDVPVGSIENITIPGPAGDIPARLYTPVAAGAGPLPALVFFHGGGFVFGNLDAYDSYCRLLADGSGAKVLSVDYRLAPEHKFPAAHEDATAAACWAVQNAISLGIDAGRMAVGGDSAGGNLAAYVCRQVHKKCGLRPVGQLLIAPLTHVLGDYPSRQRLDHDLLLNKKVAVWVMEQYLGPDGDPDDVRMSPFLADDLQQCPPAYILLGGDDPLHDEGLAYGEKLRAAGIEVVIADYPDKLHDFSFLLAIYPEAREAVTRAARAMRGWME